MDAKELGLNSSKKIDVSFSCVCPVIEHEFRHNIVKVAVDPFAFDDNKLSNCPLSLVAPSHKL